MQQAAWLVGIFLEYWRASGRARRVEGQYDDYATRRCARANRLVSDHSSNRRSRAIRQCRRILSKWEIRSVFDTQKGCEDNEKADEIDKMSRRERHPGLPACNGVTRWPVIKSRSASPDGSELWLGIADLLVARDSD